MAVAEQGGLSPPPAVGCTNFRLRQLMRRLDQHHDAELAKAALKTMQLHQAMSHCLERVEQCAVDAAEEPGDV